MEITKQKLNELLNKYQSTEINSIVRFSLAKNRINSLVINQEKARGLDADFNLVLDSLPVSNQLQSGRCWIFAGCNIIREKVAKKYNLDNFELSQSYVALYDKLERANYIMDTLMNLDNIDSNDRVFNHLITTGLEDGGQWDMFVNIIKKYGIVPKDVFPETSQSSNTSEMNRLINRKLKQFSAYLLEKRPNIEALRDNCLKDIYTILLDCYGVPPTVFDFEYTDKDKNYHSIKNLSPIEFYNNCCDIDLDEYISIINAPTNDKPFNKMYTVKMLGNVLEGKKVLYLNIDINTFKNIVIKQLENKEEVWFGSDCNQFFERDEGIWAVELLKYDDFFGVDFNMSKEEMLITRESMMNHAMVLTGVHLEDGNPTKWKIENSWGSDKGRCGYFVASKEWFETYVFQAVVNKKYLPKELLNILNEKPVELEPWDPMGTLAQ